MKLRKITPEDKAKVVTRFKSSKLGKWLLFSNAGHIYKYQLHPITHFKILVSLGCFFAFFDTTFGDLVFTNYIPYTDNFFYNLVLWHFVYHHFLDIFAFGLFYWIFTFQTKSFIYPFIMIGNVIGWHEYMWWWTYIVAHFETIFVLQRWEQIYFSNEISVIYLLVMLSYMIIKGWTRYENIWLLIGLGTYLIWAYFGFPITYDFNGATQYVNSILINGVEVGDWYLWFGVYAIIVPKTIKRRWL